MASKTYTLNVDVNAPSVADLEKQLEEVNDQLKGLDRNSDAFKTAAKDAQALTNELEKVNNEIEGLKFEDKIQAADGAMKVFAGSLSATVGALGALGVESEVFGEFEEKAASAIAVGLGIKDVSEGFSQFAVVMKKSGVAAKLFGSTTSKALIATGVGAFVVLLGTVVAYWDDITKAVKNAANAFPFVGKAINGIKDIFNDLFDAARPVLEFLGILPDEAERAQIAIEEAANSNIQSLERQIALAEAAGKSEKELYELRKQLLEEELTALKASEAEKEEIYKKETEILALELAEQRRLREEALENPEQIRERLTLANEIKVQGLQELSTKEIEVLTGDQIAKDLINKETLESRERLVKSELYNQARLDAARANSLDNVIAIAGAESKVGKAAFLAKQVLMARELVMEASKTLAFSSQAVARSTVAVAEGTAQTAKIGFPQNIPLLIGYAAQAAGIIMAIRSAVKSSKEAGSVNVPPPPSAPGGGGRGPRGEAPQPTFDVAQEFGAEQTAPTIKAYVVAGDTTSAQEADAKITKKRDVTG